MQKVKHLEYEHKHSIKSVTSEGRQLLHEEVRTRPHMSRTTFMQMRNEGSENGVGD
jgi:hypothetical protein